MHVRIFSKNNNIHVIRVMSKSKILVVSELLWPDGGGAEYATYLLLKLLRQLGFKIIVVTGTSNPKVIPGIRYYYTPLLKNTNRVLRWTYIEMLTKKHWFLKLLDCCDIVYIPLAGYPLIPVAKKKGLNVIVHLHNYMPVSYYGVKYSFENDVINMYEELKYSIIHEVYVIRSIKRAILIPFSYIVYEMSKEWIKRSDCIVCVSKRQAEIVAKRLPNKKIRIIYNPLPEWAWNSKIPIKFEEKLKNALLYTGGTNILKGFEIIIYLGLKLLEMNKNFKLIMTKVDKSKIKASLQRVLTKYREKPFIYLGRINYKELLSLYRNSIALLHPSIWEEPLPYAIVEALLSGTLAIATELGGIPEILGKFTKTLCIDVRKCNLLSDIINNLIEIIDYVLCLTTDEYINIIEYLRELLYRKMKPDSIIQKLNLIFS